MATNGIVETDYFYGPSDKWWLKVSWNVRNQSTSDNCTIIDWSVSKIVVGSSTYCMGKSIYLWVGGNKYTIVNDSWQKVWDGTLKSGSTTIYHNNQGDASFNVWIEGYLYDSSIKKDANKTFTLPTIPRNATVTSGTNFTDETNPTIYYSNPAGNAVTALEACLSYDGSVDDFKYRPIPKTGSSYIYELSEQDRVKLRGDCVDAKRRNIKLYIKTTIGGYTGYSHKDVTMTIINAEPTIDSYWAIDTNPTTIALTGNNTTVVNGYSNLDIGMSSSAKKNAYIADNQILYADSWHKSTWGTWNGATSGQIKYWTKDSRGYDKYATKNLTFVDYFKPRCGIVLGTPNAQGDMSFTIKGSYWKGNFGAKNNTLDVQYILREKGASTASTTDTWIRVPLSDITFNGNSFSHTVYLSGLDYRKTYSVQAWMRDSLDADSSAELGFSTRPVFDWSKNDFNFNVPISINGTNIFELIYPVGSIYTSVNNVNPSTLFGGTWERFANGRTLMGVDTAQTEFNSSEKTGGEKTHKLTLAEMPQHYHNVMDNATNNFAALWQTKQNIWGNGTTLSGGAYGDTRNGNNYLTTGYAGSSNAHNNLPPYITVYFWRRIE